MPDKIISRRGSTLHIENKYLKYNHSIDEEFNQSIDSDLEINSNTKTKIIEVIAKSIINTVKSPDLKMDYSLNPYQGCEHGCSYCYARPTHNYWGYSAGDEFENTILAKKNAIEILKNELASKNYQVKPIMLSGNTDCYQPAERKYKLTRGLLKVLLDWKHPVQIITKNALILRDLDILTDLNNLKLCSIAISVTADNDKTRRTLEPRASSIESRLKTISKLAENKIPIHGMLAPIIPGINDSQLFNMLRLTSEAGANTASYQIVRLNGDLQAIFNNWLEVNIPERKAKVLNAIRSCHGGQLNDSRFGLRMKGEGSISEIINQQFKLAYAKFFPNPQKANLRCDLFCPIINGQLRLW
ncbi:MAG: PA0069 family radical SAM protein [Saprospiraceae bacterium]